jgi:phage shock protein A
MGLLKRVNTVMMAQLNEIVDTFEKPERMLKQAIREMQEALERATESTAKAIACQKRLRQQLADCRARSQFWRNRAAQCVKEGDDPSARKALVRKLEYEQLAAALAEQIVQADETSDRLRRQLSAMRVRLAEAKRQLASLIVRQRSAEAQREFVRAHSLFESDVEAFDRFDELAGRVAEVEAEVDAISELNGARLEDSSLDRDVESELRTLKNECEEGTP